MCFFAAPVAGAAAAGTAAAGTAATTATAVAAYASLAATLAGTAMSVYGNIQSGKQARTAAAYNAKLAQREAGIAEMRAQDAERRGAIEEDRFRRQQSLLMGQQASMLAASGVELDSGSPLQILADTAEATEVDARTIRYNSQMEAWGLRNQRDGYTAQSQLANVEGKNAKNNAYLSAGSSLISGLGTAGMHYASMSERGMFGNSSGQKYATKTIPGQRTDLSMSRFRW